MPKDRPGPGAAPLPADARLSNGLNVASPRDAIENRKLCDTIRGLGDALRTISVPVTGGNCSLYNESRRGPIPPTPMVGAVASNLSKVAWTSTPEKSG